jgi:hypothetical protein
MSRSSAVAVAASLLLSLACGDGPGAHEHVDAGAPGSPDADTATPSLDAAGAAELRERALEETPAGVSNHVAVRCDEPTAWCGYDTVQPDNEMLAALLGALEQACQDGGACTVFLESITAGDDGHKHARISLHVAEPNKTLFANAGVEMAVGGLARPIAEGVVADVRATLPPPLRDDLHLRCSPEAGCSLRTEQVDNESVARLLSILNDRCEQTDPPACAVWLKDLYEHPENGRKVADISLTTAD